MYPPSLTYSATYIKILFHLPVRSRQCTQKFHPAAILRFVLIPAKHCFFKISCLSRQTHLHIRDRTWAGVPDPLVPIHIYRIDTEVLPPAFSHHSWYRIYPDLQYRSCRSNQLLQVSGSRTPYRIYPDYQYVRNRRSSRVSACRSPQSAPQHFCFH